MESYIPISKINDFLYCPLSLYLHSIYEGFDEKMYHQSPQVKGRIAHANIDDGQYSTEARYLQGIMVYSEKYGILGKIDIYDKQEKALIERKRTVKHIYKGYLYQLYAQKACLDEMGHPVEKMYVHSLTDNKRYLIPFPNEKEWKTFEDTIHEIQTFDIRNYLHHRCDKCTKSIYGELSW
ncbi:MAG: type V CRISPR-associated protein Cas4 [bacterium]